MLLTGFEPRTIKVLCYYYFFFFFLNNFYKDINKGGMELTLTDVPGVVHLDQQVLQLSLVLLLLQEALDLPLLPLHPPTAQPLREPQAVRAPLCLGLVARLAVGVSGLAALVEHLQSQDKAR